MKKLLTTMFVALLMVGCGEADLSDSDVVEAPKVVVDLSQLEERGGLAYFEEKPFTGVAVEKYPNRQNSWEATFKDGEQHGLETRWFENGNFTDLTEAFGLAASHTPQPTNLSKLESVLSLPERILPHHPDSEKFRELVVDTTV